MNTALHEDQMRVTSIPYRSTKMVIFSGVPLAKDSYKTNSGKYYVTIKADPDSIPVLPALGQHWSVKGARQIENMEMGDYVMQQHTYESPKHIECTLPETGEQLIRFIARESDFKGIGESKARAQEGIMLLVELLTTERIPRPLVKLRFHILNIDGDIVSL